MRRGHVEAGLARAGAIEPAVRAAAVYRSLATGVMELFWLAGRGRRRLLGPGGVASVDAASRALLDEALGAGRGVVLAASHTGNWELAACAMAERGPLSVLVKRVSVGGFDRFMGRLRDNYGVERLEGRGALLDARTLIARGQTVAVLTDQVPPQSSQGTWFPFLGELALTDRSAAALAASTGAPLVVTASRRTEDGLHVLHVLSVKWPPARGRRDWTLDATRECSAELEAFVRRYPDQWLWLHRRWKEPANRSGANRSGRGVSRRALPPAALSRGALSKEGPPGRPSPWKIP